MSSNEERLPDISDESNPKEETRELTTCHHVTSRTSGARWTHMYTSPIDNSDLAYYIGLTVITLASIGTRLYKISEPPHIA